jgi:glycine reductase complex component B subunit gamma
MQKKNLRIVHYLNQFFGGIGGEDKADIGPQVKEGPVGPGRAARQALGERGVILGTVICGDNYFAQKVEDAADEVIKLIEPFQPDALIAGPAFFAGRYAVACGAVCKKAGEKLGIPAVTGMYRENPAVDLYRSAVYILETESSAKKTVEALSKMVHMAVRLATGQKIGRPSEEGYFARGILINEASEHSAAERAVKMLLAKVGDLPFVSEVPLPDYDDVLPAPPIQDLHSATIALVTDGGLVPRGNPDKIEPERATKYGAYAIEGIDRLSPEDFQVNHAGYTPVFVDRDPNRLVPVDVLRDLEKEGLIGKLYNLFYSTSGCASILSNVKTMGQSIAEELKAKGVQAAILTST